MTEQRGGFYLIYECDRDGSHRRLLDAANTFFDAQYKRTLADALEGGDRDTEYRIGFSALSPQDQGFRIEDAEEVIIHEGVWKPASEHQRESRKERI